MDYHQCKASVKNQCIIRMTTSEDDDEHLISPQSYDSWLTLLEAAKVRNHAPILDTGNQLEDEEVPKIFYHRKCRSLFTKKRDLETLKRKAAESLTHQDDSSCSTSKRPSRRLSSEGRGYDPICIFCNKIRFQKHSKSREKLTQAVQLRADQTLRECATRKRDENILAVTSRDIVAAEAHYHVSCYKNYTRVKKVEYECKDDGDDLYQRIEKEAYEDLLKYIRTDVISNKKIVPMTSLITKLESFMQSSGVEHLNHSTKKHIRRKLESELGESVYIFSDDKGKLLMVPDSVSLKEVVLENQILHKELKVWKTKSTNINKIIDQTSSHIRSVIKQDMTPTPWPIHPYDVNASIVLASPYHIIWSGYFLGFLLGILTQRYRHIE